MPAINRSLPPYMQVVMHYRSRIASGEVRDGDRIESEREMAQHWGISRSTATKVLAALRSEGLVESVQGVGTIVRSDAIHASAHDRATSVSRTGRIYPPGHYAGNIHAEVVEAPERVAGALGIDAGVRVIRRQRTTYNRTDVPLSTSVSWFEGELATVAPLLLEPVRIRQGTFRYVEQVTGRTRSSHERLLVSAGAATEDEAEALGVAVGSPVLRVRNWYYDTGGAVLEYGETSGGPDVESAFEIDGDAS